MKMTTNQKKVAFLTAILITLTACESKEEQIEQPITPKPTIEQPQATEIEETENSIAQETIKNEETAVDYFITEKENIEKSVTKDEIKEKATDYLTTAVDFVFNDEQINGVTFSQLSDEAKLIIMTSIEDTNDIITDSGLKDITINATKDAATWTFGKATLAANTAKVGLKSIMGDEKYEAALSIIESTKDKLTDAFDKMKIYVKENK